MRYRDIDFTPCALVEIAGMTWLPNRLSILWYFSGRLGREGRVGENLAVGHLDCVTESLGCLWFGVGVAARAIVLEVTHQMGHG